jgi:hypothetical protein
MYNQYTSGDQSHFNLPTRSASPSAGDFTVTLLHSIGHRGRRGLRLAQLYSLFLGSNDRNSVACTIAGTQWSSDVSSIFEIRKAHRIWWH